MIGPINLSWQLSVHTRSRIKRRAFLFNKVSVAVMRCRAYCASKFPFQQGKLDDAVGRASVKSDSRVLASEGCVIGCEQSAILLERNDFTPTHE